MIDCLIVGYNEIGFDEEVRQMKAMGLNSTSFKDFNLGYITYNNHSYRAMDILNHFYYEDKDGPQRIFHNADVLWQVNMYLGTYLNRRGFSFDYVNLVHYQRDKLRQKLEKEDILTIVITTTIYISVHPILDVISFIKKYNKTARIIVGGPYIYKQSEEIDVQTNQSILKLIGADFFIISLDGEATLVELLKEIKGEGKFDRISNLAYRVGEDYVFTSPMREANSLEDNMIDYSLFPKEEIGATVNVRTSKSCPFACAFCGFPLRAEKYSFVSVERVERELNALRDVGTVKYLNFIDDTFNIPKNRFKDILKMMIRNKYGFQWYCFYRCDHGDREIIDLMKQAGCIGVFLGVESANDEMLQKMNKTARLKDYLTAIPLLQNAGITLFVSTIIGFPGETVETAKETFDFIEEMKPDFFRPQIWWSDPLTPIWQKRKEYGIKGLGFNWTHNTMDSKTAYDLFEKTFLAVENSIWVPDPGFNAYGMYYLLERGMSMEQVKTFLTAFNSVVKEQLLNKEETISAPLLDSLRKSCQYDRGHHLDSGPVELLSGAAYKKAEKYWVEEFRGLAGKGGSIKKEDFVAKETLIEVGNYKIADFNNLHTAANLSISSTLIAVYSILLSQWNADAKISLVAATSGLIPLVVNIDQSLSFHNFVREIAEKLTQGGLHSRFAFNILTNQLRMGEYGCECQVFEYAYLELDRESDNLMKEFAAVPQLHETLGLIMKAIKGTTEMKIALAGRGQDFLKSNLIKMAHDCQSILKLVLDDTQVTLGQIISKNKKAAEWINNYQNDEFNFGM